MRRVATIHDTLAEAILAHSSSETVEFCLHSLEMPLAETSSLEMGYACTKVSCLSHLEPSVA